MSAIVPRFLQRVTVHLGVGLALALALVFLPGLQPSADALSPKQRDRVLHIAASKAGTPYRYGASGPRAFDCSGYTRWVFRKIGRHLPHNSAAQSRSVRHVSAKNRQRGDLVFFKSGGHVYHVGIYAGKHRVWHAPRPGQSVHRAKIWTRSVSYGRVR
jgi:cell wall-associated NlpC family hydrolase